MKAFVSASNLDGNAVRQSLSRQQTDLQSDATFITFNSGVYSVEFRTEVSGTSDVGLDLPSARIDPVTLPNSAGRVVVSTIPQGGWLSKQTTAAHLLVVGGRAGRSSARHRPASGMPMPEVRFTALLTAGTDAGQPVSAKQAPQRSPSYPQGVRITAHIEGSGDRSNADGGWAGEPNGNRSLEGFQIDAPDGLNPDEIEYQAIMGADWRSPWFTAGTFCGSRGLQLALVGFRLRLTGVAATKFECLAFGRFEKSDIVGPIAGGQDVEADGQPLLGMRVDFVPRNTDRPPPVPAVDAGRAVESRKSRAGTRQRSKPSG